MVDLSPTFSCGNMKSNHVLFDRENGFVHFLVDKYIPLKMSAISEGFA